MSLTLSTAAVPQSCSRIPQELSDKIIDVLQDDPSTLRVLALVAECWRQRSQTHLFREVVLGHFKSHKAYRSMPGFLDILENRPEISRLIRTLTIQVGGWAETDLVEILAQILSSTLPFVTHLHIQESIQMFGSRAWPMDVKVSLRHALLCLQVHHLERLSLSGFDPSMFEWIRGLHQVKELVLERVGTERHIQAHSAAAGEVADNLNNSIRTISTSSIALEVLRIAHCGKALDFLTSPQSNTSDSRMNVSSLSHLVIDTRDFDDDMFHACKSLLNLCDSSLKAYTVIYEEDDWSDLPEPIEPLLFQFSRFPLLEELVVGSPCNVMLGRGARELMASPNHHDIPLELKKFGQASGYPSNLKRIAIVTVLTQAGSHFPDAGPALLNIAGVSFWRELSRALRDGAFPALQVISIEFEIKHYLEVSNDKWNKAERRILSNFVALSRRGVKVNVVQ